MKKNNKSKEKTYNLKKDIPTMDDQTFLDESKKNAHPDNYTRIKHGCNLGDIISSLAAVKRFYDVTNRKSVYCQKIDMKAMYYSGATHPTKDDNGNMVCINSKMFEMIKPLVESQEYIAKFEPFTGQNVNLDFDVIRGRTFVNMPKMMIQSWLMFAFPDLAIDLSQSWMVLPETYHPIQEQTKGKIIVNFTERYRNNVIDYFYLQNYAPDLIFAGTEQEHFMFCNQYCLNIPYLKVNDFLETAYALKAARFLLSNQSFLWNLSSALGLPRVLELADYAPNCQPFVGPDSYGFYHQNCNEYYFRMLYNKTAKAPLSQELLTSLVQKDINQRSSLV